MNTATLTLLGVLNAYGECLKEVRSWAGPTPKELYSSGFRYRADWNYWRAWWRMDVRYAFFWEPLGDPLVVRS